VAASLHSPPRCERIGRLVITEEAADLRSNSVGPGEIINGGVRTLDVPDESLTGNDIANQSGVDTCVQSTRIGQLCFRAENFARKWEPASDHCGNLDLRLPSFGEADGAGAGP
jgi:hypothetical protein